MDDELEMYKKAVLKSDYKDAAEKKSPEKKPEPEEKEKKPKPEKKKGKKNNKKNNKKNKITDRLPKGRPLGEQIPVEAVIPKERTALRLRGKAVHGTERGKQLVERYMPRLKHVLGYEPYPGTLNIKLEKPLKIEDFEEKRIQHILLDGSLWIDARLARARLFFRQFIEECWIIREEASIHEEDVIEILDDDFLRKKTGIKEGNEVEVEVFMKTKKESYDTLKKSMRRILPKSKRIIRG